MSDREPVETTNLDRYGSPPLPWARARDDLMAGSKGPDVTFFLGTVGRTGRPHAAGVGAALVDGDLYFTSGPGTRKSRDLAADPVSTLSVRLPTIDLILEGRAVHVDDRDVVARIADVFRAGGWPAEIDGALFVGPYNAPSAGPPPWQLYRFTFDKVLGVATREPFGATRWRFERADPGQ